MDREQAMQEAREEALNQAVEAFSRFGNGGIGLAANFAFEKGVEYAAASNDQLEAQKSQVIAELWQIFDNFDLGEGGPPIIELSQQYPRLPLPQFGQ